MSDKPSWMQALPPLTQQIALASTKPCVARSASSLLSMTWSVLCSRPFHRRGSRRRSSCSRATMACTTASIDASAGQVRSLRCHLHVPLVIRGPGFAPGPDVTAPVMVFQDLTATALTLAKATPGLPNQAGVSLVDCPRTRPRMRRGRSCTRSARASSEAATASRRDRTIRWDSASSSGIRPSGVGLRPVYLRGVRPRHRPERARELGRRRGAPPERDALEAQLNSLLA